MPSSENFEQFKQSIVSENESKFGQEIRTRYGDKVVEKSNEKLLNMAPEAFDQVVLLADEIKSTLTAAWEAGDPGSELAQRAADLHRLWLTFFWPTYTKAAHAEIARMYVEDARLGATYEEIKPGMAKFLRDAILIYTGEQE